MQSPLIATRFTEDVLHMIDAMLSWLEPHAELRIAFLIFLCSYGFPFSKSLLLILAGILAHQFPERFPGLTLCGAGGLLLGDLSFYVLGRRYGEAVLRWKWLRPVITAERIAHARDLIERYGLQSLAVARVTPFVRTAIFLCWGSLRMNLSRFLLMNGALSLAYGLVFVLLGFTLSSQLQPVDSLRTAGNLVILAIMAALVMLPLIKTVIRVRASR